MTGTLAVIGGGEFAATEAVDRELLDRSGAECVVVVPTADAYERPERSVTRAQAWFESLGVAARGLDVLRRPDAFSPEHVATVSGSAFLYLVGDSPMHLRCSRTRRSSLRSSKLSPAEPSSPRPGPRPWRCATR